MKKILTTFLILISLQIYSQEKEYFTASLSVDPISSFKENGLDIVGEIEYEGIIYVKVGFESFSALYGGYTDIHYSIGWNHTTKFDTFRYYAGFRPALVFRDGGHAINYGLEAGVDYNVSEDFFIGIRTTLDYRLEQKVIFNWTPQIVPSGYIRFGYRLKL